MTTQDRREFNAYLHNCTNTQVQGVLDKEKSAGRTEYVELAQAELERRGLA